MNRSCNSILCRFGIHTADPYVHIQVRCRNDAVRELLNAVGALAEMSLNFYRALLNAGATKEEAFVLLQSFISASIHGSKEGSDED